MIPWMVTSLFLYDVQTVLRHAKKPCFERNSTSLVSFVNLTVELNKGGMEGKSKFFYYSTHQF
jgi:hypothetical protein